MGSILNKSKTYNKTSDSILGNDTNWPICNDLFSRYTTNEVFNTHIDNCQNKFPDLPLLSKHSSSNTVERPNYDIKFPTKMANLRQKIMEHTVPFIEGANKLTVRRSHILEDSRELFHNFNNHKELKILFEGENKSAASDAGGLSKEWFTVVSQELLNPENKYFSRCDSDKISYFINEESEEAKDKDEMYYFVGLFMAKALFDKIPLNLWLSRAIYKYILDEDSLTLDELKDFDQPLYNSLKYINNNNIEEGSICDEMYFTHLRRSGVEEELTPGGKEIKINESNKYQFMCVKIQFVSKEIVESQLNSLKRGFFSLIKQKWIKDFKSDELESAICGESEIDLHDWIINTVYKGEYTPKHQVIRWFWDWMTDYTQEELIKVMQFCTGTQRLPIGGFKALEGNRGSKSPFTIEEIAYSKSSPYPRAHTCFNRLQLPKYQSYKELKKNMDFIVTQDQIYGFGLED